MTTTDEKDEIDTSIVKFSLKNMAPFCTRAFTSKFLIAFLNVHTIEK